MDDVFAGTPPQEAEKVLLSLPMSGRAKSGDVRGPHFVGAKKAYLRAPATGDKYVQLPVTDAADSMCGRLDVSLYGAPDAARNWEEKYVEVLQELSFFVEKSSPRLFWPEARDLCPVIDGGDITAIGEDASLTWSEMALGQKLGVKVQARPGPEKTDAQCVQDRRVASRWNPLRSRPAPRRKGCASAWCGRGKSSRYAGRP